MELQSATTEFLIRNHVGHEAFLTYPGAGAGANIPSKAMLQSSELLPAATRATSSTSYLYPEVESTSIVGVAAAVTGLISAARRWRRMGERKSKNRKVSVHRRAQNMNMFERSSLEAGAKLLEEAVKASGDGASPTQFSNFSQEKNRQSYVSKQAGAEQDPNAVDEEGLPLVYSVERIATFWNTKPGELGERWSRFLRISTPFITRFFYSLLNNRLWEDEQSLASQAVDNLTELGPTFIKLGQVLSIRPDVLPPKTMKELARLQDGTPKFSNVEARAIIEKELGTTIDETFSSFSEAPIAAASLAQVYRATLRETGEEVAVKVQRPSALGTVSKDLYVLRRLADVIQPLIRRFTADETDYIALTETFAEGLYTELDFRNEAFNALKMEELIRENCSEETSRNIIIPTPLLKLTSRRVMISRWVNGVKLSSLPQHEIQAMIELGQEVFLTQLLDMGFFHGDPHPGNLLKITEGPDAGKLCLLDFGLVAEVPKNDRNVIVSAVVHLGTQNWEGLIDDFVMLGFLAKDVDRGSLIPILQRVLRPYLKGGGAQSMKNANFQALTQDLLKVNLEVRFSIPPYVSLLARSVATLEGVALQGDPGYQIVAQAYPFVVRKLLKNENRSSFAALRELLYDPQTRRLQPQRLSTMLNASLGVVAAASARSGFIDFDAAPEDGAPLSEVLRFLLSPSAKNLLPLLNAEVTYGLDLLLRRTGRRFRSAVRELLVPRVPILNFRLPVPPSLPLPPVPVPRSVQSGFALLQPDEVFDAVLPELNTSEEVDLDTFSEAAQGVLLDGQQLPEPSPQAILEIIRTVLQAGSQSTDVSDSNPPASAELVKVLRETLTTPTSRDALRDDILTSIANELLRTWRARLEASVEDR
eukprot:TRINITY_DN4343_c6_g1_i1.p1 TRINITY_DN4343_c6_g1~~TRINITY_DN4343_c6_g1_i1.p1  ORF type:complete len:874 (-),score=166.46 TRINITY_DN4343_c6_g1_i1:116-2737(-)